MSNPYPIITLRPATQADVDIITALTNAAYEKYVPRIGRKPMPMVTDYAQMIREAQTQAWLAEQADACVGLLILEAKDNHLLIYSIAVQPTQQKQGIGKQLMTFVEQEAKRQNYDHVRLYTNIHMTENIALYTRLGYVETHREEYLGSFTVYMEKRLNSET